MFRTAVQVSAAATNGLDYMECQPQITYCNEFVQHHFPNQYGLPFANNSGVFCRYMDVFFTELHLFLIL
jgi:hypothetical protein